MANSISYVLFLVTTVLSLTSNWRSLSPSYLASAAAVYAANYHGNSTSGKIASNINMNIDNNTSTSTLFNFNVGSSHSYSYSSCNSLNSCESCTNTHTCHWCKETESCHARGSPRGCAWGSTCSKEPPKPKNNNTCAAQTTCHDCVLASHFCHWCEYDNACHAVGSRFGCTMGIDCYSNNQCRRSEAEPLPHPSSPILAVLDRVPTVGLILILLVGGSSIAFLCCCHRQCFTTNSQGAHDDAISTPREDVHFYARLGEPSQIEEDVITEEENQPHTNCDSNNGSNSDRGNNEGTNTGGIDGATAEIPLQASERTAETHLQESEQVGNQDVDPLQPVASEQIGNQEQQQQHHEQEQELNNERDNPYYLIDEEQHNTNRDHLGNLENEIEPLLHPSFNNSTSLAEQPRNIKRSRTCRSILYYLSILTIALIVGMSIFFFPQIPVYNVCNDEVAWAKIMKNIITFKVDAGFEILASLSNPNGIAAALDEGKGSFSFDGKQFGTFAIPPIVVEPMSITDLMIIVHISPADKSQAIQLAEAYYMGKLVLDAEFKGTIRVPALFNFTRNVTAKNIIVDINEIGDRSLCHCPTWDDDKNHSTASLLKVMEDQWSHL